MRVSNGAVGQIAALSRRDTRQCLARQRLGNIPSGRCHAQKFENSGLLAIDCVCLAGVPFRVRAALKRSQVRGAVLSWCCGVSNDAQAGLRKQGTLDRRPSSHAGCTGPATQHPLAGRPWPRAPEHYKHSTGGRTGLSFAQRAVPGSRGGWHQGAASSASVSSRQPSGDCKKCRHGQARRTGIRRLTDS